MEILNKIKIYSKGYTQPNPGQGCFATLVMSDTDQYSIRKKFRLTTNNRMEIMGILFALENINERHFVSIQSDSQYLVKTIMNKDYENWVKKDNPERKNLDLWKKFYDFSIKHKIVAYWNSNENKNRYYNACKQLLREAYNDENVLIDYGYE